MADTLTFQPTLFEERSARRMPTNPRAVRVPFDESETEDIVLVRAPIDRNVMDGRSLRFDGEATVEVEPVDEDAPNDAAVAVASREKRNRPPKRIGNGKLMAARVQWRPGDPFGQATRAPARGFAWNRMVRSACVTAASGLILVWLLHIA